MLEYQNIKIFLQKSVLQIGFKMLLVISKVKKLMENFIKKS